MPDYLTIKTYSNIFRVLYNATYLSREMSEKAMSVLAKADFPLGIQAGVPDNTLIAQKFGEYYAPPVAGLDRQKELHDCGIVYYPSHPYLLCIFTKGADYEQSAKVMKEISSRVYAFVKLDL